MNTKKLQKTLNQKFDNCSNATLYVEPLDLLRGKGIYYKLNIKKATVRCNETNKIISKKHWNEQTKSLAIEFKEQLKITKGGWYFMGVLFLVGLFAAFYGMYQGSTQTKAYNKNYISKTREEKQTLRANLNKNDLVRTLNAVYIIAKVDAETIAIIKSTITPTNHVNKAINDAKFNQGAFDKTEIIINKQSFIKNGMLNTNLESELGGDNIFQILDREY